MSIFKKSYKNIPDIQLVLLYQKKQDQALVSELFCRYHYVIKTVCWKYLQNEDCKDIASIVFQKFLKQIEKEIPKNLSAWIYTVSKNDCLQRIRRTNKQAEVNILDYQSIEFSKNDLQDKIEKEALLIYLDQALTQLKENQKQCVQLFYLEEKTYKEIAEETGQNIKAVKSAIQNGKRNIQIFVEKKVKKGNNG